MPPAGDTADGDEPPLVSVSVSPHEAKLLQALRAHPNRVGMWVGRGDPMKNHKALLGMYARFFEVCNQHNVEYWLEYGSVLGYVRHGGMIPWEWDMDIGCTPENFRKLQEIGDKFDDPDYGFKFYQDPDYKSAAYCFYCKADDNNLCDIAEYVEEEGDLLVCSVKDWNYPPHKKSVILPPRRVTMLGQVGMIPARSDVFLAKSETILGQCTGDADTSTHILNTIPYMQYDPIPFLLCHMFHPEFSELSTGPPVVDIPVAKTLADGFDKYARANKPFIVKSVSAFEFQYEAFRARMQSEGLKTFAWDRKNMEEVKDIVIASALAEWEAGKLSVNFVDSPIPKMVPNSGIHEDLKAIGVTEDKLMLVLSQNGTYTPFHQDPVAGASSGGGWMWLLKGQKVWNFVDFKYTDLFFDQEANSVADPVIEDLVYDHDHALWGKVGQVYAQAGDFVYFPPACNHRVWTYEDSIGIGGYGRFDFDDARIAEVVKWYESKGIKPEHGMFQVVAPKRAEALAAARAAEGKA